MHSGKIYNPYDKDVFNEQLACLDKLYNFNLTRP
ncbi:MAG: sugar O-acetyltransferase, partial [Clostridia bacterium]|nr:sugar O-acetyltransferase [Clostridia bacterium]